MIAHGYFRGDSIHDSGFGRLANNAALTLLGALRQRGLPKKESRVGHIHLQRVQRIQPTTIPGVPKHFLMRKSAGHGI